MIPKAFQLGGRTWRVERGVKLSSKKEYGDTLPEIAVIRISTKCKTLEDEEHTFMHELMHAICFTMGWTELNDDEMKIDAVAGLLRQFLATASVEN